MNRIKELREEKNLTQQQLSEKLRTTPKNIYRWENELTEMSSSVIIKIANFFEVSTDFLLGRSDDIGMIEIHSELSAEQKELLGLYNNMSSQDKNHLLGIAKAMVR